MLDESEISRLKVIYENQNKVYENSIKNNYIKIELLDYILGE